MFAAPGIAYSVGTVAFSYAISNMGYGTPKRSGVPLLTSDTSPSGFSNYILSSPSKRVGDGYSSEGSPTVKRPRFNFKVNFSNTATQTDEEYTEPVYNWYGRQFIKRPTRFKFPK